MPPGSRRTGSARTKKYPSQVPLAAWAYLAAAMASHGMLDAFTDGGLGIAFLSPFDPARYFAPFRPIAVVPIGLRALLRPSILPVLGTELPWVWLPATLVGLIGWRWGPRGAVPDAVG